MMKEFIKDLIRTSYKHVEKIIISDSFRPFCQKYGVQGWVIALILLPPAGLYIKDYLEAKAQSLFWQSHTASVVSDFQRNEPSIIENVNRGIGGPEHFVFTGGFWKPSIQDAYRINSQEIFLTEGHQRIRFDYSQPVLVGQSFRLDFALGGSYQGNLQFGRHGLYEVTIGDGDFKTVTIRSSAEVSSETSMQAIRKSLDKEILRDVANQLFITEELLSEKKMLIEIIVNGQEIGYELDLPTRWKERDDVFFGLVDYSEGGNETSVYWIEPEVVGLINN